MQDQSPAKPAAQNVGPNVDKAIAKARSIAPYAKSRAAWFCDIWGVMHNGERPYLTAAAACREFRKSGGTVLLLSNAPRPADAVAAQLDRIGVPRDAWDTIVSSGDAARALLTAYTPGPVYHLGPARDLPVFDGLGVTLGTPETAVAAACTGLINDETETAADYADVLARLAARRLPMICANPDLVVERGGRIIPCAGALAAAYEKLGGKVAYAGKPYLPVYDLAFERLAALRGAPVPKSAILAVGDGIRTDIEGAAAAGIDSVFIASPVHVEGSLESADLTALFPNPAARPLAVMPELAW